MFTHLFATLSTALGILLLGASLSHAAVWVIAPAPAGNDSNACTESSPCRTIRKGVSKMSGCDTLYLRQGDFLGQQVGKHTDTIHLPSCEDGGYTLFSSYPGETARMNRPAGILDPTHHVQINGIDFDFTGVDLGNSVGIGGLSNFPGSTNPVNGHHFRITNNKIHGLHFSSASVGIQLGGTDVLISGNEIYDISTPECGFPGPTGSGDHACYGMYIWPQNSIIENNHIHHTNGYAIHLYVSGASFVSNNIVRNNRIHDCGFNGGPGGTGTVIISSGTNNQFYNNLIYGNVNGLQISSSCATCKAYQNTIYGNSGFGFQVWRSDSSVRNNIIYGNNPTIENVGGVATDITTNFTSDPAFTNPGAGRQGSRAGAPGAD